MNSAGKSKITLVIYSGSFVSWSCNQIMILCFQGSYGLLLLWLPYSKFLMKVLLLSIDNENDLTINVYSFPEWSRKASWNRCPTSVSTCLTGGCARHCHLHLVIVLHTYNCLFPHDRHICWLTIVYAQYMYYYSTAENAILLSWNYNFQNLIVNHKYHRHAYNNDFTL